ncbi:MAG TPA: hypothetical protein DCP59_06925 [Megasphaera sp.]|nr:hypothetical protein [Megasphaera sp.]
MKFDEKAPLDAVGASFPSRGRHATQCFEPTIFIQNLAIKHRDDWRFTSGIVGGSVRCKEDGRRRSGATLTDDDVADDGHADEA